MAKAPRAIPDAPARANRALSFDQRMATALFALLAVLPAASHAAAGNYLLLLGERAMIFAIAALSLELLIGAGGLVSFGHAAFVGVGAYAAGIAASHGHGDVMTALPAALAASALLALATGAIAVRTQGVYFIMITLAFGQMAYFIATSLAPYGGDDGLSWPTRSLVLGTRILKNETVFFYLCLALLIASYLGISRLVASRFGRVLRGLMDNATRMEAIGFAPYRYRLTAYVIAGAIGGLAGFLLGNQAEFVSPAYMHWQRSGELIMMVLLGGTGTRYGPMFGALAFLVLEETLSRVTVNWKILLGPLLVATVLYAKGGIAGAIDAWRQRPQPPAAAVARRRPTRVLAAAGRGLLASAGGLAGRSRSRFRFAGPRTVAAAWGAVKIACGRRLARLAPLAGRGVRIAGARRWWR